MSHDGIKSSFRERVPDGLGYDENYINNKSCLLA